MTIIIYCIYLHQLGGIQMTTVANRPDGTFSLEEVLSKVRDGSNIHNSKTSLICVENTHNWCGGAALPLHWMNEVCSYDRQILTIEFIIPFGIVVLNVMASLVDVDLLPN